MSGAIEYALGREAYEKIDALRFSHLKLMEECPAKFRHAVDHPKGQTDSQALGDHAHMAILEPERFARTATVWDGGTRRGKAWDSFEAAALAAGQSVLTVSEHERVRGMAAAVREHRVAGPLLAKGKPEVTLTWRQGVAGMPELGTFACKGRPDFLSEYGEGALVDLKSTKSAKPENFSRDAYRYRYHAQAAFYVDAFRTIFCGLVRPYFIVAVESEAPFLVQVYEIQAPELAKGRADCDRWLAKFALCQRTGRWPGYSEEVAPLVLPRWAENDESLSLEAAQ